MDTATVIVTIVLAVAMGASGLATLLKAPPVVENITAVGWPAEHLWILGVIKLAGAAGLLVGFAVPAIGVAASVGAVLYFVGAVGAHVRAKNYAVAPAVGLLVLAVVTLVLQSAAL